VFKIRGISFLGKDNSAERGEVRVIFDFSRGNVTVIRCCERCLIVRRFV
jgi:hypothetical protein